MDWQELTMFFCKLSKENAKVEYESIASDGPPESYTTEMLTVTVTNATGHSRVLNITPEDLNGGGELLAINSLKQISK